MSRGFSNSTVGGVGNLIRSWIQSVPFVSGSTGWRISKNGNAEFNGATFRGSITILNNQTLLMYSSAAPAFGTLIASITPAAGIDSVGNNYLAGFTFYANGGHTQLLSGTFNSSVRPSITVGTGDSGEVTSTTVSEFINGPPAGIHDIIGLFQGPSVTTDASRTEIWLWSADIGGTVKALGQLIYHQANGAGIVEASWDYTGFNSTGTVTAVQPGTGTPTTPAAAETWHNFGLNAGFAATGGSTGTPAYQYEGVNGGRVRLRGRISLTANQVGGAAVATLPALYRSAFDQEMVGSNNLSGIVAGRGPLFFTHSTGILALTVAGTNGNFIDLNGITLEID